LVQDTLGSEDLIKNCEESLVTMQDMPLIKKILATQSILEPNNLNEAPSQSQKNYKRPLEFNGSDHDNLDNL